MLPRNCLARCRSCGVDILPAWQPPGSWNIVHAEKIRRFAIATFEYFRLHAKQSTLTVLRLKAAPTLSLMSRTSSRHSEQAIFNLRAEGSSCSLMLRGLRHCQLITTWDGLGRLSIIAKAFHMVGSRSFREFTPRRPTIRLG